MLRPAPQAAPAPAREPVLRPAGWPTDPDHRHVSSGYGPRVRASGGPGRMHRGVDILAPKGSPVRATAPGRVIFSGEQSGYGKLVGIGHADGYESWYAHLDRRMVQVGQPVKRGEVIGQIGRTGNATAYHVHYEVRRSGTALNPEPFLH